MKGKKDVRDAGESLMMLSLRKRLELAVVVAAAALNAGDGAAIVSLFFLLVSGLYCICDVML